MWYKYLKINNQMKQLFLLASLFAIFGAQGQTRQKPATSKSPSYHYLFVSYMGDNGLPGKYFGTSGQVWPHYPSLKELITNIDTAYHVKNAVVLTVVEQTESQFLAFWKDSNLKP
jgi:hypothetical protein